jgi:hypothetical protein
LGGFVDAVLSFPTVLFTPLLIVVIGYWLVVVAGGTDPDAAADVLGVPVSIPASLFIVFAWFGCLAGNELVPGWWVLPGTLLLALLLTVSLTVLIRGLLPRGKEPSRADFVGLACVIRTSRVTGTFGQAEVHARALFFLSRMFRKVEQGKALIVSKVRRVDVTFTTSGTRSSR